MLTTSLPLSHCHEFQRIEIAMSTIILRISSSSRGGECFAGAPRPLPAALRGPRQRRSAPPLLSRTAGRRGPMAAQRSASRAASHSAQRSLPPACPPSGAAPPVCRIPAARPHPGHCDASVSCCYSAVTLRGTGVGRGGGLGDKMTDQLGCFLGCSAHFGEEY